MESQKLLFIVNPRAGRNKPHGPLFDALSILSQAGYLIRIRQTAAPGDAAGPGMRGLARPGRRLGRRGRRRPRLGRPAQRRAFQAAGGFRPARRSGLVVHLVVDEGGQGIHWLSPPP